MFFLPDVRVLHLFDAARPASRARALRRAAGSRLPGSIRKAATRLLNRPPEAHRERLAHHYAYWREKWGFDLLNPDMAAVHERWGDTEICWRSNPAMREAGEAILTAYRS